MLKVSHLTGKDESCLLVLEARPGMNAVVAWCHHSLCWAFSCLFVAALVSHDIARNAAGNFLV